MVTMNTAHFRCDIRCNVRIDPKDLDLSELILSKDTWHSDMTLTLLFEGEGTYKVYRELWERVKGNEQILSATMYSWDTLDQHPGEQFKFFKASKTDD